MATIKKRSNGSYQITVSCGYDINGKQLRRYMTYTPEKGKTERQIKKELERQAVLFEESCVNGLAPATGKVKLSEFIELFFKDYAASALKAKSVAGYAALVPVVNAALGHMRLDKIQPHHLNAFYKNLGEKGARRRVTYAPVMDLKSLAKEKNLTATGIGRDYNVAASTVRSAFAGSRVCKESAAEISKALGVPVSKAFEPIGADVPLSGETIRHYHRFLSSVLGVAVKWQIIPSNPCSRATLPKAEKRHVKYLDETEAQRLLEQIEKEDMQNKTMIKLLMYTGMRREELCGLEWSDIDFEHSVIAVQRSSLYIPKNDYIEESGVITDTTKNESSVRYIKTPEIAMHMLREYKVWQAQKRLQLGDRWEDHNRLFTKVTGQPIHPDTVSGWFADFIKKNNLPHITIHSLRHTNATLMINSGVPLPTISSRLGHANPTTTTKIYTHAIKSADAVAAEQLNDIFTAASHDKKNTRSA